MKALRCKTTHSGCPLHRRPRPSGAAAAAVLALVIGAGPANSNETDQFLLPSDRPFIDIGRCISGTHYSVLERVVDRLNDQIRAAQGIDNPIRRRARLDALHSPRRLANLVREEFGPGFFETLGVESSLRSDLASRALPGDGYLAFKRSDWIYELAHLPVDPRNIPLLVPSSTILVYGHYLGTDKLGHFHDLGHYYFIDYLDKTGAGKSDGDAIAEIVRDYSRGIISESALVGMVSTGVESNADLVANYMGFKFYQNLTEPVTLEGREAPPLLVIVGEYWRLNTHVRPDADFLEPYFSDHWNEALNPNSYAMILRGAIEGKLAARAEEVLGFYCAGEGRPRERDYFLSLAEDLSTYYGEDYGHIGGPGDLTGIGACFPQPDAAPGADAGRGAAGTDDQPEP
ncbi:MAG: hypothetical protein IT431_08490 [Phycisphaerales bacterium]|nr:hypothetical protein [Phycisphaerales bacterium]